MTHPDVAAQIAPGPIAIEVELQRKNQAQLYGILAMYADMTDGEEAPLAGVIYITGNGDIGRPRDARDGRHHLDHVVQRATLRYMNQPVSLRLPPSTVQRLASRAGRANLAPRTLAQRYVEEGLRMDDHPLVRFVDGPAGRRARLVGTGVDLWEVIAAVKDNDGDIAETAAYLQLALGLVQAAVAYYGAFVAEVDEWIERNEHEAAEARAGWLAGQAALQR